MYDNTAVKDSYDKMKIKLILSTTLFCFAPWAQALDLVDAYERAKLNDPNWQANVLQYESDQLNLGIAGGNLLPTVTVSGNITKKNQSVDAPADPQFTNFLTPSTTTKQLAYK